MTDIKNRRCVIFDMDGVLLDSEIAILEQWMKIEKKYGLDGIVDVHRECIGITEAVTVEKVLDRFGRDFPYHRYRDEAYESLRRDTAVSGMPVKAGAHELLKWLKENGFKLGLASSTRSEIVKEELTQVGLLKYFDRVVGGEMAERSKPDPAIYLKCASLLDISPEDAIVIEDSYNGVRAGNSAGAAVIMVPDLLKPTDEMKEKASMIMGSLDEVLEFFKA